MQSLRTPSSFVFFESACACKLKYKYPCLSYLAYGEHILHSRAQGRHGGGRRGAQDAARYAVVQPAVRPAAAAQARLPGPPGAVPPLRARGAHLAYPFSSSGLNKETACLISIAFLLAPSRKKPVEHVGRVVLWQHCAHDMTCWQAGLHGVMRQRPRIDASSKHCVCAAVKHVPRSVQTALRFNQSEMHTMPEEAWSCTV